LQIALENLGEVSTAEPTLRDDGTLDIRLRVEEGRFGLLDVSDARAAVEALPDPTTTVRTWMDFPAEKVVLAHVSDVPGLGWARWAPGEPSVAAATASGRSLDNGIVRVDIADDGTFAVNGRPGLGRLVDDGDRGDTYNWCPPAHDTVVDEPVEVVVTVAEEGPLRAALDVAATYEWPAATFGEQRIGSVATTVHTRLELRAGEDLVRVTVAFDNRSRNHRLRTWFPLPAPADHSRAECAFTVVERGLTAEGGLSEEGVPTFPSRRFVTAGGLTLVHEGLLEYELVDIQGGAARSLALTLLRATGLLSQIPMKTRPLPAGPITPLEGPQMQGPVEVRYAVHLGGRDPYAVADDALVPLLGVGPLGGEERHGPRHSELTVDGAEVSAVRRVGGELQVRVFNPTDATATVTLPGRRGWLVELGGTPGPSFEEQFTLRPHQIQAVFVKGA
jgi:hypothetical protein